MHPTIDELQARLNEAMVRDRHRLRQQLRRASDRLRAGRAGDSADDGLARVREAVEQSVQMARARREGRPSVSYDETLPIVAAREEIAAAIREHQVVIVCGATGSGKSTQLPKLCLDIGRGVHGLIGHTQPRRLAARSLASRVADELNSPMGEHVGYKVRFNDTTSPNGYIKLMTDGILLAETQGDRYLDAYDTLIIDEAHERSLNIDFLLGYLRELQPRRPDLKIIITSATIDPQRFAEHFASAGRGGEAGVRPPVIEVSGRTYPVEVRYRPLATEDVEVEDRDTVDGIADALDELMRADPGDVLVFLPTERDIRETAKSLRKRLPSGGAGGQGGLEVLPLYARLSPAEQNRIFKPHGGRRVILATNVAETSLTVPGIRHVIDTGVARISRFSARAGVQRLPIEPVSQASADQRKGRCGRTSPGICIRLYGEDDYEAREAFTPPEILRTNLAAVILQMMAMGMGRIESFAFIDPPKSAMIRAGYRTLHELGAIDEQEKLTPVGRTLAKLPVDPRIGRMVMAGEKENCLAEVLVIAAALEVQEPRLRPPDQQQRADEAHARFADEHSDFMSYLKVWDFYHELKRKLSHNRLRLACQENYLSHNRMREWVDVHRQLRDLAREAGLKVRDRRDDYDALHRALLSGLLSHVAVLSKGFEYAGTGGKKLYLWPGSGLFKKKPKWVMAAELIETSQLFARTAARINPDWIEPIAGELLSRSYSEPHWQPKQGHVGAYEKVSLMGLTIVPRRKVHYGPIDTVKSRELFIHHALVEGDCHLEAPFFRHNQQLAAEVEQLEAKARRRDLLVDEQARFAFYDARLPTNVTNLPQFEKWRKQAERDDPKLLYMSERDLLAGDAQDVTADAYPDRLEVGGAALPLAYQLKPGEEDDGVTLAAPLEVLNQLDERQLDWAVPGLLREKVLALIRSLPKSLRRNFVPAPDYTAEVLKVIRFGEGSLMEAVADALGRLTGVTVPVREFKPETLPTHLRVNVRALDEAGKTLAEGRDLQALRHELGAAATERFAGMGDDGLTRTGLTNWDFDELPKQVDVARAGGMTMTGHPAVVDEGESVAVRVLDTAERARHETRLGLRRLFYLQVKPEVAYRVEHLPELAKMQLHAATLMDIKTLKRQLAELIVDRAFLGDNPRIRTRAAFDAQLEVGWNQMGNVTQQVGRQVGQLFAHYHHVTLLLERAANASWQYAVADVRSQLGLLTGEGFLTRTPWEWLASYPRYLAAITSRLQKLSNGGVERDQRLQAGFGPYWQRYRQKSAEHAERGVFDPELAAYRWMLEEFRVSLYAQELGTAISVSPQRLEKQWQKVRG
ncbi:ATP-dependent RNA helicase HrpA [Phycisphaerales bacterium AB-hyl4]|uniref:ATP-dependent RNA helicase HrpA n=1 Tax=Natronomicrosphaera hydrolytica TaxID=3242702 RepID=A0ABV4U5V7_9BACT